MSRKIAQIALSAALLWLTTGCQQEPGALLPVTGRVTFKGVPLNGGLIVFTPDATKGEHGPIAHSIIQADGTYSLFTDKAPGAHVGWYKVTFSSPGPAVQPGQSGTAESSISPDYRHPDLSKITCRVDANQANSFDFDLK